MKNVATIKHLRSNMFKAESKYHQAVIEELKRIGTELEVVSEFYDEEDEENGEPKGCKVTSLGEDNESFEAIIDKIRYEESEPVVKVAIHVVWYDYKQIDQWWGLNDLIGEAADYVIDSIVWPEDMNQGEAEKDSTISVFDRLEAIKSEHKDIVATLLPKAAKNGQTLYGELSDWLRDYHNDLSLEDQDVIAKLLLGEFVIHHPDCIKAVKPATLMVLRSYVPDEEGTEEVHLVVSKHQFDTNKTKVGSEIEALFDLDLYDEDDLQELRDCIADLLQGNNGVFGDEYYWEEIPCVI